MKVHFFLNLGKMCKYDFWERKEKSLPSSFLLSTATQFFVSQVLRSKVSCSHTNHLFYLYTSVIGLQSQVTGIRLVSCILLFYIDLVLEIKVTWNYHIYGIFKTLFNLSLRFFPMTYSMEFRPANGRLFLI